MPENNAEIISAVAWDNVPEDALPSETGEVLRRFVGGQQMTIARISFSDGASTVPHKHLNEQFSMVLQGEMEFTIDGQTETVREGQIIFLPSNSFHGARANTASVVLDMFAPPRADWGPPKTG